jgi:NADH/F420H2 dehydrogenase subunit C
VHETATSLLTSKYSALATKFSGAVIDASEFRGETTIRVDPSQIREVIRFLKEEPSLKFEVMMDLFGTDYLKYDPPHPERYCVTYILYSMTHHRHLTVKAYLSEDAPEIDSIHDIYAAANWFEREAWDLYGVTFKGHPNLIRILCHNDFVGHPLRKDYPAEQYQRLKNASSSTEF